MTRPTTMEGYLRVAERFCTDEGYAKGLAFKPDPTDIIISPFAKCGTTWMQQIVHGLRSGGDMSFGEITQAVPWIELAHDIDLDLSAPQIARPRAFKSHLGWDEVPKGARYIVVLRDPLDAMVSLFRFMNGWFFEEGSIPLEAFAMQYLERGSHRNYWAHAAGWWGQRGNADVLLLAYEHMKVDLDATVARVAGFMGGYAPDRIALATRQARFGFMKAHVNQFDDNYLKARRDPAMGLPLGSLANKVNQGRVAQGKDSLPPALIAEYEAMWASTMLAQHGLKDYAALLDQLRA